MNNTLSFPNKNLYRKYPFRSSVSLTSEEGAQLPLTTFSCAKLLSPYPTVFVRKIVVRNGWINVTVSCLDDGDEILDIGFVHVTVTSDFQTVLVSPLHGAAGGSITFGLKDDLLALPAVMTFSATTARIEDSLVVLNSPPAVERLLVRNAVLTGMIDVRVRNLTLVENSGLGQLQFEVERGQLLTASADGDLAKDSCGFPAISSVAGVTPDVNGNIDIYCISPLAVQIVTGGLKLSSPEFSLEDACSGSKNNIPVSPANYPDTYPGFMYTDSEEWRTWPQYA